jgi:hypothetical protein
MLAKQAPLPLEPHLQAPHELLDKTIAKEDRSVADRD